MSLILSGTDGLSDVDGSAATPAIRGTDANTGIFFPAADTVGVSTGGSERMRIDSSGNVGIGVSTVATNFRTQFLGTAGSNTSAASSGTTQAASAVLRLQAGGGFTGTLDIGQGGGTGSWLQSTDTSNLATTYPLLLNPVGGNVGIGTSSPSYRMDVFTNVSGGNNITYNLSALNSASAKINYAALGFEISQGAAGIEAGAMIFRTYGSAALTERARIDSSGNLLVGATSVFTGTYAVNVMGAAGNRAYLGMKRETASTTGACGSLQSFNGANTIASIDFAANGANNSGLIQTYTWSAGSVVQGPYVNTGGTSWTTASDETLKDIIAPIEEATSKLSGLRTVFGKYKTDHDDVRRIFLIAQDVQKVLPEAVSTDGNGKLGLNYQDLVPVLVKAIKEQQALIQSLTTRITALENK